MHLKLEGDPMSSDDMELTSRNDQTFDLLLQLATKKNKDELSEVCRLFQRRNHDEAMETIPAILNKCVHPLST
jgi:hypothetical protein